jgi:hypothetical protein
MNRIMLTLRPLLAAGLIGSTLSAPILAAPEEKPAAEIKTKAIEASVTIDAKLKTYPALYARLIADGKREMTKWRVDSEKERKQNPDWFKDRSWSFARDYSVRSIIGRYVSIVRSDQMDGGGAHPNQELNTLLWDAKTNKFMSIRPFFKETADNGPTMQALAKTINEVVAAEKKARDIPVDELNDPEWQVKPKLTAIGGLALAPSTDAGKSSGFSVYFGPYAVGPYVDGSYIVFVPWTAFKAYLSPEGTALFGGERPKDDRKNE